MGAKEGVKGKNSIDVEKEVGAVEREGEKEQRRWKRKEFRKERRRWKRKGVGSKRKELEKKTLKY